MSLIQNEVVEDVVGTESSEHSEPTWWWDKSTPGDGDRPEWLPEKYKSAEDAARAFKELEKKLGSAPDKYDWSKGAGWIDEQYEPLQKMAEYAKSKHVPQDVFDNMLETVGAYLDEFNTDYEEERKALGDDAETRLKTVDNWAKSNFSEETYATLIGNLRTANDVKAIEELRNKMVETATTIPSGNEVAEAKPTVKEVQSELNNNYAKYKTDETYRNEIKAKLEKALG
jgi:hypothetical protein